MSGSSYIDESLITGDDNDCYLVLQCCDKISLLLQASRCQSYGKWVLTFTVAR